jgi:hypothetical protein
MRYLTKKLLVALAVAAMAGSGVAALPAVANAQSGALFDGFGKGIDEDAAVASAESAARQNALVHGFTDCDLFETVVSQDAKTHVWFAVVAVRCEDVAA